MMTNEEAIAILKPLFEQCKGTDGCLGYIEHYFSKDEEKALDLAIQALETGEIYITGEDYNLYMRGYKAGRKDFEPPKGKWVKSKDGYTRCDKCGSRGSAIKARFCHHCGADMRGGVENGKD